MSSNTALAQVYAPQVVAQGVEMTPRSTRDGVPFVTNYAHELILEGRAFAAGMSTAANSTVTTQTSFADTTPSFMLSIPAGTTVIPLFVELGEAGTVAGAVINVVVEAQNADPYASGGTAVTAKNLRFDTNNTPGYSSLCTFRVGPTVTTANYGVVLDARQLAANVSTAPSVYLWTPTAHIHIVGPASFKVYTWAGTTAPTWMGSIGWAEIPTARVS